jgi:uncharacterized protein (DUF111 family)
MSLGHSEIKLEIDTKEKQKNTAKYLKIDIKFINNSWVTFFKEIFKILKLNGNENTTYHWSVLVFVSLLEFEFS